MDFFIMTASITGVIGQSSQINYAAANTYQDALARHRVALGEKAVALDLGLLLTGGLSRDVAERLMKIPYIIPISESQIQAMLEYYCNPALEVQMPSDAQAIVGLRSLTDIRMAGRTKAEGMYHPMWRQTLTTTEQRSRDTGSSNEETGFLVRLQQAETAAEAAEIATGAIVQRFSRMIAVPQENINRDEPFHVNGADSLSAIDLRNWIMKTFGVDVPVFDILGSTPVTAVGNMIAEKWSQPSNE